jgi:hypothetical protein
MDRAAMMASRRFSDMELQAKIAGAAIGAAMIAAGGIVLNEMRKAVDAADELGKSAARIGVTTEALSGLQFAAEMSGISAQSLQANMTRLNKAITEGNDAFGAMGVSVKNADGTLRSADQVLLDVADRFRSYEDGAAKSALAMELFGKSGAEMLTLLNEGAGGITALTDEAAEFGLVLDQKTTLAAAAFNDNLARVVATQQGIATQLAAELLPVMEAFSNELVRVSKESDLVNIIAKGLTIVFQTLVLVGSDVIFVFRMIAAEIIGISRQLAALATLDLDQFSAIGDAMKADAATARAELDAFQARIMAIGTTMANAGAEAERQTAAGGGLAAPVVRAADEASKAAARMSGTIQGLQDEILRLTEGETALALAQAQRNGATEAQLEQIRALIAERNTLMAMDREMERATQQFITLDREAIRAKDELRAAGLRVYEETRSPLENLNIRMGELNSLLQKGAIDWDTYSRAVFQAQDEFDNIKAQGTDAMQELQQAVEGWGRASTDAFVNFAFGAKASFGDLVNSILQDIARLLVYQAITKPLMGSIGGLFGFAKGGIMTGSGPAPLRAYATGGIANSPQLALFGEGSTPEAFVPLPDGRTIPVTLNGGGGGGSVNNVTVNVSMENGGMQTSSQGDAAQLGKLIAVAVRSELVNQKRPGGMLAA